MICKKNKVPLCFPQMKLCIVMKRQALFQADERLTEVGHAADVCDKERSCSTALMSEPPED